jgi:HNH endonuclease
MDPALRQMVRLRAGGRCEYCLLPQDAVYLRFHVEHVVARQHGGDDDPANLALACDRCNRFKGPNLASIDPQTQTMVRLFHPRQNAWSEHFGLVGVEIIGRTDVGRTTVALLQMNAQHRLELRRHLLERGEFVVPIVSEAAGAGDE